MLNEWREFLQQAGARWDEHGVEDFGDPAAELQTAAEGGVLCDLSHYGLLRLQGEDTATFLQGQLTNDVRRLDPEHSQLSAYCSPKGRILANFRLLQRDGAIYMRLPVELAEPTAKRLRMFILMSKVQLEEAELVGIGAAGSSAEQALSETLGALPQSVDAVSHVNGISVIRVAGTAPRFEIYGEPEPMRELWQKLAATLRPVGRAVWQWLEIRAGLPTIYPATVEAFVPQMVNLNLVGGVSFKKGCYTGQEVVARMQYLGKLKRRMYLAHVQSDQLPQPGEALYCAHSESGQGTGKVVAAQPSPDGGYDLLSVIQISDVDSGQPIQLGDADGPALQLLQLPYPFEATEAQAAGE